QGVELLHQQADLSGEGEAVEMPTAAAQSFARGIESFKAGEYGSAAAEFAAAVEAGGGGLTEFYLGYALQLNGKVRDAVSHYEAALEEFPNSSELLSNLGYARLSLGRYDLALEHLRAAVDADSENAQAQMNLGLTYFGLRRYEEAVTAFERAVEIAPNLEPAVAEV